MVAGTFIATSAAAQPYFSARIGFRIPQPRVYCAPTPPVVVYSQPVCQQPVAYDNQGYYDQNCDSRVVYENRQPVYYRENVYARPRYVEVNRYQDRGYRDERYHEDHRRNNDRRRW